VEDRARARSHGDTPKESRSPPGPSGGAGLRGADAPRAEDPVRPRHERTNGQDTLRQLTRGERRDAARYRPPGQPSGPAISNTCIDWLAGLSSAGGGHDSKRGKDRVKPREDRYGFHSPSGAGCALHAPADGRLPSAAGSLRARARGDRRRPTPPPGIMARATTGSPRCKSTNGSTHMAASRR